MRAWTRSMSGRMPRRWRMTRGLAQVLGAFTGGQDNGVTVQRIGLAAGANLLEQFRSLLQVPGRTWIVSDQNRTCPNWVRAPARGNLKASS
jgi:hypothetical protein